jgi:hypothetical protein
MRRRFITRSDVEDAHRAGRPVVLAPVDVITHEAAQRARDLGVTVERSDGSAAPQASGTATPSGDLRGAVRSAVVAELGHEPPGLDAAIDRVLQRRQH